MPMVTIMNTGACFHLFRNVNDDNMVRIHEGCIGIVDDAVNIARHVGTVTLYKNKQLLIRIDNVRQCPNQNINLISVIILNKLGYKFEINNKSWSLTHNSQAHPNLSGPIIDNNPVLEHDPII